MVQPYFHLKTCCIVNNNKHILDKAVSWLVEGLLSTGPTPSSYVHKLLLGPFTRSEKLIFFYFQTRGLPWYFRGFSGLLWTPKESHGTPWNDWGSQRLHLNPWRAPGIHLHLNSCSRRGFLTFRTHWLIAGCFSHLEIKYCWKALRVARLVVDPPWLNFTIMQDHPFTNHNLHRLKGLFTNDVMRRRFFQKIRSWLAGQADKCNFF